MTYAINALLSDRVFQNYTDLYSCLCYITLGCSSSKFNVLT